MAEKGSVLTMGQRLIAGDSLLSPLGNFRLLMQLNGNLVIYARSNQSIVWQSQTSGVGNWALLQSDGNFVVYDLAGSLPLWNSETGRDKVSAERFIALQDDSNLVIYDPTLAPVWSSLGGSVL